MAKTVWWIDVELPGRLGIVGRPRGGDWLSNELRLVQREGVNVLVSLLEKSEVDELGLTEEGDTWGQFGGEFVSYPIPDRDVPNSSVVAGTVFSRLVDGLGAGKNVGIHCRMGIGRSAIISACLMLNFNFGVEESFELISQARGLKVPDTDEQVEWVRMVGCQLAMRAGR